MKQLTYFVIVFAFSCIDVIGGLICLLTPSWFWASSMIAEIYIGPVYTTGCSSISGACVTETNEIKDELLVFVALIITPTVSSLARPILAYWTKKMDPIIVLSNVIIQVSLVIYLALAIRSLRSWLFEATFFIGFYIYIALIVVGVLSFLFDVAILIKEHYDGRLDELRSLIQTESHVELIDDNNGV
jgi:hypothetical protein